MRHALTVIAALAVTGACASPGLPPGGPTISSFPRVIATLPDTGAVNVRPGKVLVRYDDVISEQATGGSLSRVVLISPWDGEPKVDWRRTGMAIAPRKGWRMNTAYTITILPGVGDLQGKPSPYGYVLRFSTGPTIPTSTLRGVAFDWVANKALPKATIQAVDLSDTTLMHVTVADSTGRYALGGLPSGTYLVRAVDEKSPNRYIDAREPWDSTTVILRDSARADLYMFVHDTMPVRINELRLVDSVTISLVLDKPLLPGAPIGIEAVRVVKSDSTVVAVRSVLTGAQAQAAKAREDSLAQAADTTSKRDPSAARAIPPRRSIDPLQRRDTLPVVPPPEPKKAPPATELVVTLAVPLQPATTYRITLTGVRNLVDRTGEATRLLIVPKAAPVDTTRQTPDAAGDSIRTRPATVPTAGTARPPRPPR